MATPREELLAFQKRYPTAIDKKRALRTLTDRQIDRLVKGCSTKQGKIFYSLFKNDRHKQNG